MFPCFVEWFVRRFDSFFPHLAEWPQHSASVAKIRNCCLLNM
nr:MAG TPA: hypothetical protein [Caudoviricetes sp.]